MSDSSLLRASRELYVSVLTGGASDVEGQSVERMAAMLEEETVERGRRIFAEGEAIDNVYFMRDGRVRLEREGEAVCSLDGSNAFGAFEAVLGRPHARSAVALEPLLLMRIPAESWLALLEDDFDLAALVVMEGLRRLADLEVRVWPVRPDAGAEIGARVTAGHAPLTFLDRVALLASMSMLRGAGIQVLVDLSAMARERTLEAGEVLHTRGVASGHAFLVLDGEILGLRTAPDISLAFGSGSLVCGAAWLGAPQLAWETRATKRTRLLVLDAEHWFDMMEEHPELLRATLGTMALAHQRMLEEVAARTSRWVVPE